MADVDVEDQQDKLAEAGPAAAKDAADGHDDASSGDDADAPETAGAKGR